MSVKVKPHGCHNQRPYKATYVAFDGYVDKSRTQPKTVRVRHVMTRDCQYSKHTTNDPRCIGCRRKHENDNCR